MLHNGLSGGRGSSVNISSAAPARYPDWRVLISFSSSTTAPRAILIEAPLSYLGIGAQPPVPSWGSMLSDGHSLMRLAPWIIIFPGLAIVLTVLGFNLFGDGLRDALAPRLKSV